MMMGRPASHTARTIVVLLAAGLSFTAAPAASAHHAPGPCDFHREEGVTIRRHSRDQIRCAVKRWSVPGGATTAVCIARRESGLLPWAESRDGLNKGLFQQHVRYWDGNYDSYTRPGWELRRAIVSGRTNTVVSIRMAHDIGWGPWGGRDCG
jgi:hypothetical protein